MSAYRFNSFNPLSGVVPYHPFSILPTIAWRARGLLESFTSEQIDEAAQGIECAIDEYFRILKITEIERLRCEAITLNQAGVGPEWPPNEDDLDIPTASDTSEVDALKICIDDWDKGYVDEEPYILFAVQALSLLAETMYWLSSDSVCEHMNQMDKALDSMMEGMGVKIVKSSSNLSIAGDCALKALDAVCHAEQLRQLTRVEARYVKKLMANDVAEATHKEEQLSKNKALNDARHRKRNEAVEKVTKEWEKDPSKFLSAEKAGLYYADWLDGQGFKYEPRTVTGWIRTHAKDIGVRFR